MSLKAGFRCRTGKGSHTIWEHPLADKSVTLSGKDKEDFDHMSDPKFWEMIADRRKQETFPWEQIQAEMFSDSVGDSKDVVK